MSQVYWVGITYFLRTLIRISGHVLYEKGGLTDRASRGQNERNFHRLHLDTEASVVLEKVAGRECVSLESCINIWVSSRTFGVGQARYGGHSSVVFVQRRAARHATSWQDFG